MNIGISSACMYPKLTEESLKEIGEAGVKYAEIFFNASCELEDGFVKLLREIKDFYGMKITSVHPTLSLAESFMLFSNYPRRYDEGIEQYRSYGEIAKALDAKYVIMHGGKPNNAIDNEIYFDRFARVSEIVEDSGATLLQENVVKFRAGELKAQSDMIKAIGDRAKFCLDIKQCVRGGYTPFDAIEVMKDHIKHVHISDHNAQSDCLLPLRGDFDFKTFFAKLADVGYKGDAVIEVYRDAYIKSTEIFEALDRIAKL